MKKFKTLIISILLPLVFLSGCSGYQTRFNNIGTKNIKKELHKSDKTNIVITVLVIAGIVTFVILSGQEKGEYRTPACSTCP